MVDVPVPDRLLAAAERLFLRQGIDAVSLREIKAASGVSNASAIQYHFGDRAGLIRAVIAKHQPHVETRRHALLDQYEADAEPDLRRLAGALVRPLAAELTERDGGSGYLQILADLVNRPQGLIDPRALDDPGSSTYRWRRLVETLMEPEVVSRHRRYLAIQFSFTELARRGQRGAGRNLGLFVSELIDLVQALLSTPLSEETRRHLG